jgi:hypothetical protein
MERDMVEPDPFKSSFKVEWRPLAEEESKELKERGIRQWERDSATPLEVLEYSGKSSLVEVFNKNLDYAFRKLCEDPQCVSVQLPYGDPLLPVFTPVVHILHTQPESNENTELRESFYPMPLQESTSHRMTYFFKERSATLTEYQEFKQMLLDYVNQLNKQIGLPVIEDEAHDKFYYFPELKKDEESSNDEPPELAGY